MQRLSRISLIIPVFLIFSCTPRYKKYISSYNFDRNVTVPDYSKTDYWAAHPYKHNPSDSLPDELRISAIKDTGTDVFFLHPTTFGELGGAVLNADINDPEINAKTDYKSILFQASAFNECRVFAPRYRQASYSTFFTSDTASSSRTMDIAYGDLKNAFQYYLDHFNNGRPVIIASHSQGSRHALRLLHDFFENKPLQKQLVAAYIIGYIIPTNYFTTLPLCKDSLQTGCYVGWRTFKKGFEADYVKNELVKSVVVNPLSWTTTNEYVPKTANLGGVLLKFEKVIPHVADAEIHDDILWIHKPHFFPQSLFFIGRNYHIGDINLFYMNIRENVHARIQAFRKH